MLSVRLEGGGPLHLAHCCAIFLCYLGRDDHYRNPNINDRDHLVGQLTRGRSDRKEGSALLLLHLRVPHLNILE